MQEFIDTAERVGGGRRRAASGSRLDLVEGARAWPAPRPVEPQPSKRVSLAAESSAAIDPARAPPAERRARCTLEQRLLDESEPPATRWYRHVIYGWNIYSLYEGQPLPGLAEAIRLGDAAAVAREITRLEQALDRFGRALEEIARLADTLEAR